jgi:hypothetical protein
VNVCQPSSNSRTPAAHRPHASRPQRAGSRPVQASSRRAASESCSRSLAARGPRGELRLHLQVHQGGLYVEREEIPLHGLHCVQSMHFVDVRQFERWCEGDPARFEHPLLHLALRREAEALWRLGEQDHA